MKKLSDKVVYRLTLYHSILVEWAEKRIKNISSPQIARLLKIDNSQVRKDLASLKQAGKCKVGYLVEELRLAIEEVLGFKDVKPAVIVGAGNLGIALARYNNFTNYGLNILALFDNDPLKVGLSIDQKKIFHIVELNRLIRELKVKVAILTVPRTAAQECAIHLANSGIEYIWNFSPKILELPEQISVLNENLVGNFLQFRAYKEIERNGHN